MVAAWGGKGKALLGVRALRRLAGPKRLAARLVLGLALAGCSTDTSRMGRGRAAEIWSFIPSDDPEGWARDLRTVLESSAPG